VTQRARFLRLETVLFFRAGAFQDVVVDSYFAAFAVGAAPAECRRGASSERFRLGVEFGDGEIASDYSGADDFGYPAFFAAGFGEGGYLGGFEGVVEVTADVG